MGSAGRGAALREFALNPGFGFEDYLLYVDGKARGVIEARKQGATLAGVETQSGRYAQGLPAVEEGPRKSRASRGFLEALDPRLRALLSGKNPA